MTLKESDIFDSILAQGLEGKIGKTSGHAGEYYREDGLHLQQDPYEFAEFLKFISDFPEVDISLDIGVGAGGSTKLIRDYLKCQKTIIVDAGIHKDFRLYWPKIRKKVKSEIIRVVMCRSDSYYTWNALRPYCRKMGFVFIDGGHSYEEVSNDIKLALLLLAPSGIFAVHDYCKLRAVQDACRELLSINDIRKIKVINRKFGIAIWQIKT